jgi:hydrogenase-4 component E
MSGSAYLQVLDLASGAVLACAVVVLWRRDLRATVSVLALQGVALGLVAAALAAHTDDAGLGATAAVVLAAKGVVVPALLRRVLRQDPDSREAAPLVNVPASLVAAAVLILVSFLVSGRLTALVPAPEARLAPIGLATLLIGFFTLVSRRKAVSQIVGLLLVDNGVALVTFLLTAGVPLAVELGASLDVLLVIVVLRVLATTMCARFGHLDLDQLRELHD